jgi:hypothetical protein
MLLNAALAAGGTAVAGMETASAAGEAVIPKDPAPNTVVPPALPTLIEPVSTLV